MGHWGNGRGRRAGMTGREWKSCGLERMGRREIGEMGREENWRK